MDLHQLIRIAAAAVAPALLAGCGAAGSAPTRASASAAVAGVHLTGTITLRGDYTLTSSFSSPATVASPGTAGGARAPSCGAFATGASAAFILNAESTTPRPIYVAVTLPSGYAGPGTYASTADPSLHGTAAISIPVAEGLSVQTYHATDASPMQLTVHADGSGMFTFQRWPTDEMRGQYVAGHLDGTVSWRCS